MALIKRCRLCGRDDSVSVNTMRQLLDGSYEHLTVRGCLLLRLYEMEELVTEFRQFVEDLDLDE